MKRTLLLALICLPLLSSCDQKTIDIVRCAIRDETLSVAFRDPQRAREYLRELGKRLQDRDPEAVREAGDLVASLVGCLPQKDVAEPE